MSLMHNIKKNKWDIVNKILIIYFPNRTTGITTQNDALKIYFNENKKIKKEKEKVIFSIYITFTPLHI